jgi:hypothetical protein
VEVVVERAMEIMNSNTRMRSSQKPRSHQVAVVDKYIIEVLFELVLD